MGHRTARVADDLPHRVPDRARLGRRHVAATCRGRVGQPNARLGQPAPGEDHVDGAQTRRHEARDRFPPARRERREPRPDNDTGAGRRRQPAQRLGALMRLHGVGHVRLGDPRRASAEALHEARREQQPEGAGEPEDDVGDRRSCQADQQHRAASVAVGHPPPDGRGRELSDRERGRQEADGGGVGVQPERVERQQRQDHHQADHVHERHGHEHRHPLHRRAPTPRTTALNTIRITPNPAATPSSDTRRLDMISIAIGRLSGV